jgi:hypothetical protein
MSKAEQKQEGDWQEVKAGFWKIDPEVKSSVIGTYVDRKVVVDKMAKVAGTKQAIYSLLSDDGKITFIGGRGKENPKVIAGIEQVNFGAYIKVAYEGKIKSLTPGWADAYIIRVYEGKPKPEVLAAYKEKKAGFGSVDAPPVDNMKEEIPFA